MNSIPELEQQLLVASERRDQAMRAVSRKHQGGEWEELDRAEQEVLKLERALAAARNEEYAEPFGFPLKWDIGAPMPHLLRNDGRALLAFLISEPDPNWDGSYVTIKSAKDPRPEPLGLVEFEHCLSARLGSPNDEVLDGHPLSGRGLEAYRAQRVVNSRWLRQLEEINSVHRLYQPQMWRELHHYVFWFHDSTFECICRGYRVETHRISMREMLVRMVERLLA